MKNKFRAWNKEEKRWATHKELYWMIEIYIIDWLPQIHIDGWNQYDVMQSSWYITKKWVEVFVWDITKIKEDWEDIFYELIKNWPNLYRKLRQEKIIFWNEEFYDIEKNIIWNIYENPELVNEEPNRFENY